MIDSFRDKCAESGRGEGALNGSLCKAFTEFEKCVMSTAIHSPTLSKHLSGLCWIASWRFKRARPNPSANEIDSACISNVASLRSRLKTALPGWRRRFSGSMYVSTKKTINKYLAYIRACQTTLQVDQVILLSQIKLTVDELRDMRSPGVLQSSAPVILCVL